MFDANGGMRGALVVRIAREIIERSGSRGAKSFAFLMP